jgi:hypothetical protein
MRSIWKFGFVAMMVSLLVCGGAGIASAQDSYLPLVTAPTVDDQDLVTHYVVPAAARPAALQAATSHQVLAEAPPLPWYEEASQVGEGAPVELGEFGVENGGGLSLERDYTGSIHTSIRGDWNGKMWTAYPYKTVGKLYIYDGGAYAGYCSASVIGQRNHIVTAAHCTYDLTKGDFFDSWVFVPPDRNGVAPYGSWTANGAAVLTDWSTSGGRNNEVSVLSLQYQWHDGAWRPISYFTGWLGRVWGGSY